MYADYLVHFNPNHDPKTGQFTYGNVYQRRALNAAKTKGKIDKLYQNLSLQDRKNLGEENPDKKEWLSLDEGEYVVKRYIKQIGNQPVAAIDLMTTTKKGHLTVAIMTDPDYRGKGYASELVKKGMTWYDKNKEKLGFTELGWGAYQTNIGSKKIAEKSGFTYNKEKSNDEWAVYDYK